MQENNNTGFHPNKAVWYATACMLLVVIGIFLFRVDDSRLVSFLLLAGGLTAIRVLPFGQWTAPDICVGMITLYDLVSCLYAVCPLPAIRVSLYSLYALVAYLTFRRLLAWQPAEYIVRSGCDVLTGIALVLAVLSFFVFRNSVLGVGFEDTYHFRFLFRPLGYITNVWSEVLLLILGWACLVHRRYAVFFVFLTFTAIFLSFSRGAYIASGIYLVGSLLVMYKTDKLRVLLPALAALALVVICCPNEMRTTLAMNHTASQRQSTESRVKGTLLAWTAFKARPFVGYGNGNYMYALDSLAGQDSTKPFTSMAPNTLARLLVEKGVVGTLLYVLLFIAVSRALWQRRKRRESRIIGCTLLALFVKDMSQSAWEEVPFLMLMVYLLLAYLQREEKEVSEQIPFSTSGYMIAGLTLTTVLLWNVPDILQTADPTGNYLERKDYQKAWMKHPEDVQLYYLYATRTLLKENPAEADNVLRKLAMEFPRNSLYLRTYAERCYDNDDRETACRMMAEAIRYTPRLLNDERMQWWKQTDSLFHACVIRKVFEKKPCKGDPASDYARYGYIAHWTGDTVTANTCLREAVKILPNLVTPYLLLKEYDKYKLLIYGAFHTDLKHMSLPEYPLVNEDYLLEKQVVVKVKNWYEAKLQVGMR